ncbi:MAG TPA: GNAT family N-acetyltransferase [Candidatus Xenobia bacterium]|jgi:ribosomal protein S18 acetylase RimI-like enzyme
MSEALFEVLPWDSDNFHYRIAKVTKSTLTPADVAVLKGCETVDCFYLTAELGDMETILALNVPGVVLAEVRVDLDFKGSNLPESWSLQPATEGEVDDLAAMSRNLYRDSRFYCDRHFRAEDADRLYETWIRQACAGTRGDQVLVVRMDGRPVGYSICQFKTPQVGSVPLLGVAKEARGQGLGVALMRGAVEWFSRRGADYVVATTQGRNIPLQRVLQAVGYRTSKISLMYHYWPRIPLPAAVG